MLHNVNEQVSKCAMRLLITNGAASEEDICKTFTNISDIG